jgi:hypothetical protein
MDREQEKEQSRYHIQFLVYCDVDWLIRSRFFESMHFTLDLLFMMLCMYNHLLTSHLGRKASFHCV